MKRRKNIYLLIVLILAIVAYLFNTDQDKSNAEPYRAFTQLIYSDHARCRMGCRDISEREIKKVLKDGRLNRSKSGYDKKYNDETYALEGYGDDNQYIRVVVTPRNDQLFVITVIDLRTNWACDCD